MAFLLTSVSFRPRSQTEKHPWRAQPSTENSGVFRDPGQHLHPWQGRTHARRCPGDGAGRCKTEVVPRRSCRGGDPGRVTSKPEGPAGTQAWAQGLALLTRRQERELCWGSRSGISTGRKIRLEADGAGGISGSHAGQSAARRQCPGWLGAEQQGWVGLKGTTSSAGRASHLGSELVSQLQCLPRERGRAVRPQAHRRDKQVSSCPGTAADTSVQRVCAVGGGPAPTKTML